MSKSKVCAHGELKPCPCCTVCVNKEMAMGLRIIATWAACDSGSNETRIEAMEAIRKLAMQSLGKESKKVSA